MGAAQFIQSLQSPKPKLQNGRPTGGREISVRGHGVSSRTTRSLRQSETEIVKIMLPLYFTHDSLTAEDIAVAKQTWQMIVSDQAPVFLARKGTKDFQHQSAVTFFYDQFYVRLFDIHPICRHLFRNGMKSQGTCVFRMMSLALSELDNPKQFKETLQVLVKVHYGRGVKAVECK